jgi:hypothetical protein
MSILVVLLQIVICAIVVCLLRRPMMAPVLSISLAFYVGLWFVLPALLGTLMADRLFAYGTNDYADFCRIVCLESAVLIVCLLMLLIKRPFFKGIVDGPTGKLRVSYKTAVAIAAIGLAANVLFDPASTIGGSYAERNLYAVAEMGTDKFNGLGPISVMIALWTCFAYVAMLDRWSSQKTTRAVLIVVWLWIALITARGILEGVGITALLPFIMLIMMAKTRGWNRKRAIVVCGAFALITATAGSAVGDIIRLNRFGPQFDKTTILKQAAAYFQGNSSGSERTGLQEMVTQSAIAAFMKFDSFSGGELLLREGGPGAGGLKSVASSFLAIVPRTLMPDKPVPGSADGTYLGVPARIAGRISGMDPFSTMTGVTPCAIAIWQLGYPNVLLLIVGNVAFLMFLNSLLLTNGFFLRALAIYLIGLPTFWPVFPSPDVVIMNMERALLVYALISVCGSFLGSAKRRQQAARIEEGPDRSLPLPSNGEA